MKLKLIKATEEYKEQICDYLKEWYDRGEKIVPYAVRRLDYHDFKYYCENLECKKLVTSFCTDSTFFCLDEDRDIVVGAVNIRHYQNEQLLLDGGHIGDGVRPSERGKGIATQMIAMALDECRKLGIFKVLMTCDRENPASARTIIKNGGVLENEVVVDGVTEQRYWIDLLKNDPKGLNPKSIIRHISIDETAECAQLIRASFMTVADEFGFTAENAPRFTAFATDENRLKYQFVEEMRPMYAYLLDGAIVGYYSISVIDEDTVEMNNLAVLPQYRHRGIGAELVRDCFEKAGRLGAKKINIGIVEENKRLKDWYESFGFVQTGTQKFDFFPFTCGYMSYSCD